MSDRYDPNIPSGGHARGSGGSFHLSFRSGSRGGGASGAAAFDYVTRNDKYDTEDRDPAIYTESDHMPSWAQDDPREYWDAADLYGGGGEREREEGGEGSLMWRVGGERRGEEGRERVDREEEGGEGDGEGGGGGGWGGEEERYEEREAGWGGGLGGVGGGGGGGGGGWGSGKGGGGVSGGRKVVGEGHMATRRGEVHRWRPVETMGRRVMFAVVTTVRPGRLLWAARPDAAELADLRARMDRLDVIAERVLTMTPAERGQLDALMKRPTVPK